MNRIRRKQLTTQEMERMEISCRNRFLVDLIHEKPEIGASLPGERTLAQRYNMPLSVIRGMLSSLKSEGIIRTVPRGGTRLSALPGPPATLAGTRFAMIGYIEETNPKAFQTSTYMICAGIERELNEQGITLMFYNLWPEAEKRSIVKELMEQAVRDNCDAILIAPGAEKDGNLKMLKDAPVPVVAVVIDPLPSFSSVRFDERQIGRIQAEHLIENGHSRIAAVRFPGFDWSRIRTELVVGEYIYRGLPPPEIFDIPFGKPIPPCKQVKEILRSISGKFTAIAAPNDDAAVSFLQAAWELNLSVPEDFSVIGVDDLIAFRSWNLTTVQCSWIEAGRAAFNSNNRHAQTLSKYQAV